MNHHSLTRRWVTRAADKVLAGAAVWWIIGCLWSCERAEPVPEPAGRAVRVEASEPVRCDAPERRDEAAKTPSDLMEPQKPAWFWGGGVIAADFDLDGHVDVLLPGFYQTFYYRGLGGGAFEDATDSIEHLTLNAGSGGSAADFDGDGDLDVLFTRFQAPNLLLRNDDGVFVDVSVAAGLSREPRRTMASSWGDVDRDGDLDLFVGNYGFIDQSGEDPDHASFEPADPSWWYLNDGDGTFTDVSDRLPSAVHDGYTFSGGFIDIDADGWLDLYVVNDFGNSFPNVLMHNEGGELVFGDQRGLDVAITGMGIGVGDVNDDGLPDFAMTQWNGNSFLWSSPAGWIDHTIAAGLVNDL